MIEYIKKIIVFGVIMTLIDIAFGSICSFLHTNAHSGGMAKRSYVAHYATEDIIMFGSSRMAHHYNPNIISDSTGFSCFNAGQDGNGIIFSYGLLCMLLQHHIPQLVVYDLYRFDYCLDDNMKYINLLKPYYKESDSIRNIINSISPFEKLKMQSSLYMYNSLSLRLLGSYLKKETDNEKGFIPLYGQMNYEKNYIEEDYTIDPLKMSYLKRLIKLCQANDIKLVFFISPLYNAKNTSKFDRIKELCRKENIEIYDYFSDEELSRNKDYYEDQSHMNKVGADAYSRKIVQVINNHIQN